MPARRTHSPARNVRPASSRACILDVVGGSTPAALPIMLLTLSKGADVERPPATPARQGARPSAASSNGRRGTTRSIDGTLSSTRGGNPAESVSVSIRDRRSTTTAEFRYPTGRKLLPAVGARSEADAVRYQKLLTDIDHRGQLGCPHIRAGREAVDDQFSKIR